MSLSSSLFTGTSGLKNMGNALQVVGNNISNLNTIGFKKGRSAFADTLYESVATQAGSGQVGRGMSIGSVSQNFAQGSFESTGNTTDLSIGGDGFFIMRQSNSDNTFYTRAGNFFFDKTGQLVNPEGYVVQGWELDEETGDDVGAIKDLVLNAFTSPPKKSSTITAITNLDADAASNSVVLSNNWDSGEEIYMAANNYEYPTVVKVYDSLGSTHDVSIYYDKKSGTEWEYIVTCNPEEDKRNSVQGTDSKGLLARGTITFSQSSGDILDITMSEFTGRLGNFQTNGVNTTEMIDYQILNYDELADDGYGFEFEFDGSSWDFVGSNPLNYEKATIVYSDNQEIHLVLNQTSPTQTDPDLKIKLTQPAVATDSFGFDINNKNDLHTQGIEGTKYFGDTVNDNTTLEINDPSVMTHDSSGLGIVWNPNVGGTGKWYWSNPEIADAKDLLISEASESITKSDGVTTLSTDSATTEVLNPEGLSMVADMKLRYDGANWDWNDGIKEEDFINTYDFVPSNDPSMSIIQGTEGAIATTVSPTLYWLGDQWSLTSPAPSPPGPVAVGNAMIEINTVESNDATVVFDIYYNDAAGATTVQYTFGSALTADNAGNSISFTMDPTPPREYLNAAIDMTDPLTFDIYFDEDAEPDISCDLSAGGAVGVGDLDAGTHFVFRVDPDVPPAEYENATLKGDQNEVVIDLDGSGNDSDNDDIRFVFDDPLKFGVSAHSYEDRSEIDFDILGSTAWTQIDKNNIEQSGYFSFTTDFLGGEYGSTENDIALDMGTVYKEGNFVNDSLSTTQYSKSSSTVFQDADGYSAGDLQGVDVSSDGIMTGVYSNGQLMPLFRVGLAKFLNNYGLFNKGGNLFMETRDSGGAITNKPGENGLGTIAPNSLEMSNVDISEEFVALISNQRGFQANSKTVTTIDAMMETVIQMKR
ncbi:flagellar hook-basal body complex protein [Desulfobacula phenolica]|uniref:Flagellar hook protein FlgE n=1 Tax=Desulfobacula phenolica TaxID=90732 RepID=A0A1H2DTX3_9BACT|nr:flagellar hook-basal body complex protein [Desulfobacula phenolica]SDT85878.1 flagellar hook protein FlgE [Desulfobacula phenolica]